MITKLPPYREALLVFLTFVASRFWLKLFVAAMPALTLTIVATFSDYSVIIPVILSITFLVWRLICIPGKTYLEVSFTPTKLKTILIVSIAVVSVVSHHYVSPPPQEWLLSLYQSASGIKGQAVLSGLVLALFIEAVAENLLRRRKLQKIYLTTQTALLVILYHGPLVYLCLKSNGFGIIFFIEMLTDNYMSGVDLSVLCVLFVILSRLIWKRLVLA